LAVRTPEDFGVFKADEWLNGIAASSRECPSGDPRETRRVQERTQLCDEEQ
jgi:hypothetical protein